MNQTDEPETFYTISEAARMLGVSAPTLRRRFDAARPASGEFLPDGTGRTGSGERRVAASWVRAQREGPAEHAE